MWNIAKTVRGVAKYGTDLENPRIPNIAKTVVSVDPNAMEFMIFMITTTRNVQNLPKRY